MMNNKIKGIYVHIPFCEDICFYCDFCKLYYNNELANKYLKQLKHEISLYKIIKEDIKSIYIGGGTPSVLNIEQLNFLFDILNIKQFTNLKYCCFEANPESLSLAKIEILKKNGVNRVSLGIQSINDSIIKSINRKHNKEMVLEVLQNLKRVGIDDINLDFIYGFKNQSIANIKNDLEFIKENNVKHISYYSLLIEEGTVFSNIDYQKNDDDNYLYEYLNNYLVKELNFERYEVSNYAKNKKYSYHNLLYWQNEQYYGFGLGASGFIDNYRYYNTKSITKYLKGNYNSKKDYYHSKWQLLEDEILLQFRRFNGIDLDIINKKYSIDFTKYFNNVIITNINKIEIIDNILYFTNEGKNYLNDLIIDFIDEIRRKDND